jgi:methionine biosynthesis protein MetW
MENIIKAIVSLIKGGKVLDVGCGKGRLLNYLPQNVEYHGIDFDKKYVKKLKIRKINAKLCDLNKHKIPYKRQVFDYVFCISVLEHLFYPKKTLKEIKRVLKDSGVALIYVPNAAAWYHRLVHLFKGKVEIAYSPCSIGRQHIHHFTLSQIREFISSEFTIIKEIPSVTKPKQILIPLIFLKMLAHFWPNMFVSGLFIVCKKQNTLI